MKMTLSPSFNPYKVSLSRHAKRRFCERYLGRRPHEVTTRDLMFAESMMRDMLFEVCTQHPVADVRSGNRKYRYNDSTFVLSNDNSEVVTFYSFKWLSAKQVKKIRKEVC